MNFFLIPFPTDCRKYLRRSLNFKFLKFEAACTCHNSDECCKEKNQMLLLIICYHFAWPQSLAIILRAELLHA